MPVPFSFSAATTAIPLSQLDSNFNTPITLGNTAIQLGNTVTTLNNMTLANVTISSGNVTITNVTVTTANVTTVNTTTLIATTANVTTGNVTNLISGNVTLTGGSITGTTISGSTGSFTTLTTSSTVTLNGGTANGVAYLNGSKVLTTGSALTFDGSEVFKNSGGTIQYNDIRGSAAAGTRMSAGGTLGTDSFDLFQNSSAGYVFNRANTPLIFGINNSEQMRLDSSGNLGIGTSSPSSFSGYTTVSVNNATNGGIYNILVNNTETARLQAYSGIFNVAAKGAATNLTFETNGAERMRLDSSGNLGLGVTPSAWMSGVYTVMDVGAASSFGGFSAGASGDELSFMATNAFFNSSNTPIYKASGLASNYRQFNGVHQWLTAPSGTAGNAISFTQALTLDANRNLLLNGTSAGASSVGTLTIFNGTAPTGSVTDGVILFAADISSSSELRVRDEAGNVTTLSPHNFSLIPDGPSEEMAWAYYSEKGGKRINVDMLKLARMVEKLTGEKLVYES